jgi:DegV family protein with EDD domain
MRIVTDCAADLTPAEVDEFGINVAPLFINFPEGMVNALEMTPDEFYNRLEAMAPEIPSTSQPSGGMFAELYDNLGELKEEILSIHISSGLSGTSNSAQLGASQAKDVPVTVVDTLTLSGGERFQVLAAARAIKAGWSKEKILAQLDKVRSQTETIYTLDTLVYLARGGRIGRVQALAGLLLHLKPVIHVAKHDGKYSTVGKARTISKALATISDTLVETYGRTPLWVTVLHGSFAEQAENLGQLLQQTLNIAKMETMRISPVLGVHTGPGIVGCAVVPIELMDEIS